MSWPLASFSIVAAVLVAGWLAYERSRPSARTVALVATLAALAALGRDAFAALPEVKPITAMTFVVGYALGPLPGFAVGAIGMLVSNFLLGQGPYTPWQMVAWGVVGLLGALAGALSRRRLKRLPLALGCAAAALVAMAIMALYEWNIGAIHTLAALLALTGPALPFYAVDVGSTFLFALLFGPELARLLGRARHRTSIEWRHAGTLAPVALLAALTLLARPAAPARAAGASASTSRSASASASESTYASESASAPGSAFASGSASAFASESASASGSASASASAATAARIDIARGVAYLASAQNADGGFGAARGSQSSSMFTAWAGIGLAAAGVQPRSLRRHGRSAISELRAQARSIEAGAGGAERTMLALRACNAPVATLGGLALSRRLLAARSRDGSYEGQVNLTAFAIFALLAAGDSRSAPAIRSAARWLARQQNGDGGFSFATRGDPSDVDDTAAAVQALIAAGTATRASIGRAVRYLQRAESPNGGFPQEPGGEANAQSSAWAVQALAAAGAPIGIGGLAGADTPIGYLERAVAPDGSVRYSSASVQTPVWVTAEALAAFAAAPLPILAGPAPAGSARELASGAALDGLRSVVQAAARLLPLAG
ncbi:MAG: prenyltransferase/squalene oxidase repeat-containing protein [Solirubrobacteraceae bacterium]